MGGKCGWSSVGEWGLKKSKGEQTLTAAGMKPSSDPPAPPPSFSGFRVYTKGSGGAFTKVAELGATIMKWTDPAWAHALTGGAPVRSIYKVTALSGTAESNGFEVSVNVTKGAAEFTDVNSATLHGSLS